MINFTLYQHASFKFGYVFMVFLLFTLKVIYYFRSLHRLQRIFYLELYCRTFVIDVNYSQYMMEIVGEAFDFWDEKDLETLPYCLVD